MVANRLADGRVVFLAEDARWVEPIEQGFLIESDEVRVKLLEIAERAVASGAVVDPYLIEVAIEDGRRRPLQLRESIRAFGPTVADPRDR